MPDLISSTLGPYRILEQIGLGGMATVYKAYQPGMDRLVALKVLPQHYARDPRFTKRFEQEARVIAKLEHRNIVPVYDFGEQDGTAYLAMRYLQAGTVKEILSHGLLPLSDAAKLLSDIASALDYAHSQGIIHRDIKPSNILVDKQGNAYLTDFGIAKVIESTMEMTGSAALGTPAYMAPEQTLGKAVTPQSDVYSLGVMLYEMVTGKPPFEADTPMAIALMHVHEPLPLPRKVKQDLPEGVELVILKALAKEPKDRFGSASELARAFAATVGGDLHVAPTRLVELASVAASGKGSEEVTYDIRAELGRRDRSERTKRAVRWLPAMGGGVLVILLIVAATALLQSANVQRAQSGQTAQAAAALVATASAIARLPTDTPQPTPTANPIDLAVVQTQLALTQAPTPTTTPAATSIPKTSRIAFASDRDGARQIYVMNSDGSGVTRWTATAGDKDSPAWSPDGQVLAFVWLGRNVYVIDEAIAVAEQLTSYQSATTVDRAAHPAWSPRGDRIIYEYWCDAGCVTDATISSIKLDGTDERSETFGYFGLFPAWSPDARKVIFGCGNQFCIWETDTANPYELAPAPGRFVDGMDWSPDGAKIVFSASHSANSVIYVMDTTGANQMQLTDEGLPSDNYPSWSPDGSKIVFCSNRDGNQEIYVMNADGSNQVNLTNHPANDCQPDWGPEVEIESGSVIDTTASPISSTTTPTSGPTIEPTFIATLQADLSGTWTIYAVGTTTGCTDAAPPPLTGQTGSQNNGPSNFQVPFNVTQNGNSLSGISAYNNHPFTGTVSGLTVTFQISGYGGNFHVPGPSTISFTGTRQVVSGDGVIQEVARGTYVGSDTAGYGCQYSGSFTVYLP